MSRRTGDIAKSVELMLVRPRATPSDCAALCRTALERHVAAVCVPPTHVVEAAALLRGEDPDSDTGDMRTMMRSVLREGLLPALRVDAVVLRAFLRNLNLLSSPDSLMKDPEVMNRVFAVWQDRENRPPEVPMGPKRRSEFLELLPA